MRYGEYAIHGASECRKLEALEWWKNSGLELKYNEEAIDELNKEEDIRTLEWWK